MPSSKVISIKINIFDYTASAIAGCVSRLSSVTPNSNEVGKETLFPQVEWLPAPFRPYSWTQNLTEKTAFIKNKILSYT